ncbi:UDP-glycosyltransferase 75B1-like [Dioscorea cayenensis subsp. rotundata]|uniref:UDP-glycosyltransferase 75B1-like n=1 Tax=Dioscorea cayennensis subsp. rotundata TaxID=55577 RepID=A0AB40CVN1_DIOCR|nr:UDP-glycosyltransferase 75B1-like [Dioscorea cayenensis subsp. rotundata]
MADKPQPHFLFITYPMQSHINPSLNLAKHIAATTGTAITFSTTVFTHRRMFSSTPNSDKGFNDGLITYLPFSDGFDEEGYKRGSMDANEYRSIFRINSKRNVSILVKELTAGDRPVTCMIHTIFLNWVVEIAGEHGIPSVLYWIQAASVFATELFEFLDEEQEGKKRVVLMNTFHEWETDALASVSADIETIPIGLLPKQTNSSSSYLFKEDEKKYME